jgi:hypothetical protein
MLNCPRVLFGSKPVILPEVAIVIVPPYLGVPRLSHQFPVEAVVVVTVEAVEVVDVGIITAVVEVVVVAVAVDVTVVGVLVVVDEEQDASTSDITIRQVNTIQITFPFMLSPFYLILDLILDWWKIDYTIIFRIFEIHKSQSVRPVMPLTPITPRAPDTGGDNHKLSFESNHKLLVPWIPLARPALPVLIIDTTPVISDDY